MQRGEHHRSEGILPSDAGSAHGTSAAMGFLSAPCAFFRQLANLRFQLVKVYGATFTTFLVVVYCGLKGTVHSVTNAAMLPLFKSLGMAAEQYQLAQVVTQVPWAAKGCIGVLSDCFPIGRYHKRGYLLVTSGLGIAGMTGLILLTELNLGSWAAVVAALLVMLTNFQLSTFDLLAEGKYSELMRSEGAGSEVLSLVWSCVNGGFLIGSVLVYFCVDRYGVRPLLLLNLLPMAFAGLLAARGYMPEEPAKSRKALHGKLMSSPRLFMLAFCMALGACSVAAAAALGSSNVRLVVTLLACILLTLLSFVAMPWTLAMSNLYMFLSQAVYLDLGGPLGYYYTAGPNCVPGGPNFSYGYYLAIGSFVGALAGGIGSLLFQGMSTWSFRMAFSLTTVVQVVASVFDLIIVKRWNLAWGISDETMYFFGDGACQQLASMLTILPSALLTSRLCPRGAEATVYAVLAGFSNFGQSVSGVLGVRMAEMLGIETAGAAEGEAVASGDGGCNFSALPAAIVLSHMVLPMLVLPLTFFMVPEARMDEEDAFLAKTPPPSFCSPAASPSTSPLSSPRPLFASPRSPHAWPGQDPGYRELPDGPEGPEGGPEGPGGETDHEIVISIRRFSSEGTP